MIDSCNEVINFGQYKGLTIKEIYQGTLNINRKFLSNYLSHILNKGNKFLELLPEKEFIERIEVTKKKIKIVGEIHNPDKTLSRENRVTFGNLQNQLSYYINSHFEDSFLGILENIQLFNKHQMKREVLGGDPKYLEWCEREIKGFKLDEDCKKELEKLQVAIFTGFQILNIKNDRYEYLPTFKVELFKFNINKAN
jgi:hypothetical protein